jgi:hypothetical protein
VLVPDERTETHRYRIAVSDSKGRFELRGIPPGAYEVLAWPALDGAPYRNPEFLKNFNGTGRTANIDGSNRLNIDLPLSDEAPK